jgi:phage-related minor tail protein
MAYSYVTSLERENKKLQAQVKALTTEQSTLLTRLSDRTVSEAKLQETIIALTAERNAARNLVVRMWENYPGVFRPKWLTNADVDLIADAALKSYQAEREEYKFQRDIAVSDADKLEAEQDALQKQVAVLTAALLEITGRQEWWQNTWSDATEAVLKNLYPFSKLADEPTAPFVTEREEYDAQISDLRYGGCN